jgi:hypothetical protein
MNTDYIDKEIEKLQLLIADDQKKIDLIKLNIDYYKGNLKNALKAKKELESKKDGSTN